MDWEKSPESLIQTFHDALPDDPRVERRKMFGYPSAFVGGNLVAGVHRDCVFVRLAEADRASLLAEPGATVFAPMESRPMNGYIVVPPAVVKNGAELRGWLKQALNFGLELPAKEKKPARAPRKGA